MQTHLFFFSINSIIHIHVHFFRFVVFLTSCFAFQLSDYELCIAANLVDPSSLSVSWNEIGGLEDVISQIQETVIFPFCRTDLFKNSSLLQPPKGLNH